MRGASVLTMANPGWHRKRSLTAGEFALSWNVGKSGLLSAKIPARTAATLASVLGRRDLKGAWVAWRSPQLGNWGGIIRRNPTDVGDGLMELSADSFEVLFKGVLTRRTYLTATGSAGNLALNVITDSATDRQLWIDDIAADDTGPTMSIEWRGDDLYDVLDELAQSSGYEWNVFLNDDWTIAFRFRKRIGSSKLGAVLYAEGYNIASIDNQVQPSIETLANDIRAVPGDQLWETAPGAIATDSDSIVTYGRQAYTRRYVDLSGPASLETRARSDLILAAQPATPATIVVPVTDRQLPDVRIGDSVRYWSARQNARYELRIMSISYEAASGQVKLAGDGTVID